MGLAHNAVTELHGFEHIVLYGLIIVVFTIGIKLLKKNIKE